MSKLIVGLGNPGSKYKKTRHNIGFVVLDFFAKELGITFSTDKKLNAEIAETNIDGEKVILLKPQTFMNLSGDTVSKATTKFKIEPEDVWVVHDDVDLDFGVLRVRLDGSAGGHNGIKSIIERLGTKDFARFKFGVDSTPENIALEDWVLSRFDEEVDGAVKEASSMIASAIKNGIENTTKK